MIDFLSESLHIYRWMRAIREDIHAHPETGNEEYRTTDVILKCLKELNLETYRPLPTGVIGVLHGGKPGSVCAFRADIDALPVTEETGLSCASVNTGVMHTCGHDMHTAALLGTARILSMHKEELQGSVVFIFQPDEEGDGGAKRILDTGILDEPGVKAVYGAHIEPSLPAGTIGVKYGSFYANAATIDITVHGHGGHAAEPEKCTDSLYACARLCAELKKLTKEEDGRRSVCTIGSFHAGNVRNIISDRAECHGILRCSDIALRETRKQEIVEICQRVEAQEHVTADLVLKDGYPGVFNHDEDVRLVQETAEALLGKDHVVQEPASMTTEDFGFFLEKYEGCYYHIGVDSAYPLHNARMNPKEEALGYAAAVHSAVVWNWLERHAL